MSTMALGALGGPAGLAVGAGLTALGAFLGSRSKTLPPPQPIYPQQNQQYLAGLTGSGVGAGGSQSLPGLGPQSLNSLTNMAMTGMPTDYSSNLNAIIAAQQRSNQQSQANMIEKFGASGLRFSQPLIQGATDLGSQISLQNNSLLNQFAFQTQESAANRMLSASSLGANLFSGVGNALYPSQTAPGPGVASSLTTGIGDVLQTMAMMQMLGLSSSGGAGGGTPAGNITGTPGNMVTQGLPMMTPQGGPSMFSNFSQNFNDITGLYRNGMYSQQ